MHKPVESGMSVSGLTVYFSLEIFSQLLPLLFYSYIQLNLSEVSASYDADININVNQIKNISVGRLLC